MDLNMVSIDKLNIWRANPRAFVEDPIIFGATPDKWQAEDLEALPHFQRFAWQACKGPGKTTFLAWAIWWFLVCFPRPKIAATSISADNLSDNLWAELATWQKKSPLLIDMFDWTKTRIAHKESPEDWWASARTWPKTADSNQQGNTLAGLHAEYLLFVLDEVGGIPDAVMAAAEAGLANDHTGTKCKILMAGNPTHLEGPLWRAATTERDMWRLREITADPNSKDRTPRVSIQWALDQIKKYGADNPWVLVNVFGKFPPSSINTLLGPDIVSEAMSRKYKESAYSHIQKRLGVDVALQGDDRTVLFPRQGLMAFKPVVMRTQEPADIAARVILAKSRFEQEINFVDATGGWGSGVISHLSAAQHDAHAVQFAGKAIDEQYFNKRAEMWWQMCLWIKEGGRLPNIPGLSKELTAPTYTLKNGKFLIEPKDSIKSRLGFSPDMADALGLTFALPDQPRSVNLPANIAAATAHGRAAHDYDPLDRE